jgi:hypothetical protein
MAIAIVGTPVKAFGNDTFTTGNYNTTGANALVVPYIYVAGVTATLSDSPGNTWLQARLYNPQGVSNVAIFYSYYKGSPGTPIDTSSTHTVTLTGTDHLGSLQFYALSGVLTSSDPLDATAVDEDLTNGTGSVTTGPVTPAEDNSIIFTNFEFDNTPSAPSIGGGFSTPLGDLGSGGTYRGSYSAYLIQTTKTAASGAWTRASGTGNNYATIATFKAGAAAATVTVDMWEPHVRQAGRPRAAMIPSGMIPPNRVS